MKHKVILLSLALLTWVGNAFADKLSVVGLAVEAGSDAVLTINFDFTTTNLTGYQFDLVLPEGITVVDDEDGFPAFEVGEGVYYKSHTISASHLSSCDRFVCLSTSSQIFKKMGGVLLTIPVSVDAAVLTGSQNGRLKSIQFGTKDGQTLYFDDVPFKITVGGGSEASGDRLSVGNINMAAGSDSEIAIDFSFETDNFTGYQFDLVLPTGFTTVLDEDDLPMFELGDGVYYKSHTISASHLSFCDRFVCLSTSSQIFKKKDGVLLTLPIHAAATVGSGIYEGLLKNIQFGTKDGKTVYLDNATFNIIVGELLRGDINRDRQVTIADVTALVNIILGKATIEKDTDKYDFDAADVNGDGKVTVADVKALVNVILGKVQD